LSFQKIDLLDFKFPHFFNCVIKAALSNTFFFWVPVLAFRLLRHIHYVSEVRLSAI